MPVTGAQSGTHPLTIIVLTWSSSLILGGLHLVLSTADINSDTLLSYWNGCAIAHSINNDEQRRIFREHVDAFLKVHALGVIDADATIGNVTALVDAGEWETFYEDYKTSLTGARKPALQASTERAEAKTTLELAVDESTESADDLASPSSSGGEASLGGNSQRSSSSRTSSSGICEDLARRFYITHRQHKTPPGKLGIMLTKYNNEAGAVVCRVFASSVMAEKISTGDRLVAVDGEDVSHMTLREIISTMARKDKFERSLTFLTIQIADSDGPPETQVEGMSISWHRSFVARNYIIIIILCIVHATVINHWP
jgi:hypothetical protein